MNTCPGASHELTPQRLDEQIIRSAAITFLEGYLWGPERPRHAMLRAAQIAHEAGRTVAFTLSESLCIPGRKEGVLGMIEGGMIDILFANEDEAMLLAGRGRPRRRARTGSTPLVSTLIVTRGRRGRARGRKRKPSRDRRRAGRQESSTRPARATCSPPASSPPAAARARSNAASRPAPQAAAEVISHFGARPEANLKELVGL